MHADLTKPVGAIVLAAGFSTRFGASKLLAPLKDSRPIFQHTMARIAEAFPERIVVTRTQLLSELQALSPDTKVLAFERAEEGMGATLAFATRQIESWSGCLICLGDMPFIKTQTYQRIAECLRESPIVIPTFESKAGNPVAFSEQYFDELRELHGDAGGKRILQAHENKVLRLAVADPGVLQDIDTKAQLETFQQS